MSPNKFQDAPFSSLDMLILATLVCLTHSSHAGGERKEEAFIGCRKDTLV
jgi:hypothetical protein